MKIMISGITIIALSVAFGFAVMASPFVTNDNLAEERFEH